MHQVIEAIYIVRIGLGVWEGSPELIRSMAYEDSVLDCDHILGARCPVYRVPFNPDLQFEYKVYFRVRRWPADETSSLRVITFAKDIPARPVALLESVLATIDWDDHAPWLDNLD